MTATEKTRRWLGKQRYRLTIIFKGIQALLHLERPIYRAWVEAGRHNAGYCSTSGIVVLPPSVRNTFKLPALLVFIPDGRGRFIVMQDQNEDLEVSEP